MKITDQELDKLKILRFILGSIYDGSMSLDEVKEDFLGYMVSLINGVPDLTIEEQKVIKKMLEDEEYNLIIPR